MIKFPPDDFWPIFKSTNGALSCAEAIALYNIVSDCEQGDFIELGSHKGKSSLAIALAMPKVSRLILVEPEFEDRDWAQEVLSKISTHTGNVPVGYGSYSLDILPIYNVLSFCFVDSGNHSDDLVMTETKMLEDKIIKGGIIAYHDKGSQFIKVNEAYDYLLATGKYEEIKIEWEPIFDYVKEHDLETGNLSWHLYPDLSHPPNFVGALKRK